MFEFHQCAYYIPCIGLVVFPAHSSCVCARIIRMRLLKSARCYNIQEDHDDEKLRVLLVPEEWATSSSPRGLASTVSLPPG